MKFGKEFASQMIPEWQQAHMNYSYLKAILKDVEASRNTAALKHKLFHHRSFSGLTKRYTRSKSSSSAMDVENHDILVNTVTRDGKETSETTFLKAAEAGGESELVFFRALDQEFNKVSGFYRSKVEEMVEEAISLNKQMDAFIAFKIKVDKPSSDLVLSETISIDMNALTSRVEEASDPSPFMGNRQKLADQMGMKVDDIEHSNIPSPDKNIKSNQRFNGDQSIKTELLNVLDHIKLNNMLETPRSTIRNVLKVPKQEELKFTRENLKKIKQQLKKVLIEFHHKLRLLKNYSFLNTLAFSKTMKKYDKITSRNAAKLYMEMVDSSYLASSDKITKLMLRVESTFVEHFSNGNRSKGMRVLRPNVKKERHRVTFSTGFMAGCTVSLIIALALLIHARNIMGKPGQKLYMETKFPLYRFETLNIENILKKRGNDYKRNNICIF